MSLSSSEQNILDRIVVGSENDPLKPEFPADDPKFPATPTYPIRVPWFQQVLFKDESFNPTGTHKDRMAWEIVVTYRDFLIAKKRSNDTRPLPKMSIISSWSAAVAIQMQLRKYSLPDLKVLVDRSIDAHVFGEMESIGCEVYKTDLSARALTWKDILALTDNINGIDITSNEALSPTIRFYDWLSYEIINSSPEWCFVPFWTGNLYENILNITKREVTSDTHDPRFFGNVDVLRACHFMGATTNDPTSRATKLYSPHLPFVHFDEQWIRIYRQAGYCGSFSDVSPVREKFIDEAYDILCTQNIKCEPSGAAGLALLLQMRERVPAESKILIVSTGKTREVSL